MKYMGNAEPVSIIIPVYNVAPYLDACLASVVAQTYEALEIILVDDGSTDGSGDLCRAWQTRDPRITVYANDNHGVSYTRNYALDRAHGTYVTFVDSDDTISPHYVETLVGLMDERTDLAVVSYGCFSDGESFAYTSCEGIQYFESDLECTFFGPTAGMIWSKLYRRAILEMYGIRFDERIAVTEDLLFNFHYAAHARALSYNASRLYGYRRRAGSAVRNTVSPRWFTCLDVYRRLFDDYAEHAVHPHIIYFYLKNLYEARYLICHCRVGPSVSDPDVEAEIRRVRPYRRRLTVMRRAKLFICQHFFGAVEKHRR